MIRRQHMMTEGIKVILLCRALKFCVSVYLCVLRLTESRLKVQDR